MSEAYRCAHCGIVFKSTEQLKHHGTKCFKRNSIWATRRL